MIHTLLRERFGFETFRTHQEEICHAIAKGEDALVVMPTGAGKSLCYQIPGLARGGTTLVISPLVALIEDQVARLLERGIRAGRIHSGRAREDSRETFRAYLRKELDFLFIAPERLAVPGFTEMLARHPPSLVAVDEAHCISHWGHDFRPDYRLVGERLRGLSQTPMVALTATATELVQNDICTQLGLRAPRMFIHGFRRDNLEIRLQESLPRERTQRIEELLSQPDALPAIVYAPTRKKAEELTLSLKTKFRVATYHAGLTPQERERAQSGFLSSEFQVIIATVAFGMGIDKRDVRTVVHAALPGSVEAYYQEIGRAGRDGQASRAILLYGYSDRKTHEFFLERDHPSPERVHQLYLRLPEQGSVGMESLRADFPDETFEKALEKLRNHGGAMVDREQNVSRGNVDWMRAYRVQREHRFSQIDFMQAFTEGRECRMLQLLRHFGDPDQGVCGKCDRCTPERAGRPLSAREHAIAVMILASLAGQDGQSVGRLLDEALRIERGLTRTEFERLLSALERAEFIEIFRESFQKDGRTIHYRKVSLKSAGRRAKAADLQATL
jgi:RecQ family ATP-dependent DNA helicase